LGQMIAMRYGCLPIVRKTGGLKDTVKNNKTGLVFSRYHHQVLLKVLNKAVKKYQNRVKMKKMISLAMQQDFSWDKSAKQYLGLYKKLV
jgi:starch synthase